MSLPTHAVGLDLSLTKTGLAGKDWAITIETKAANETFMRKVIRLGRIEFQIAERIRQVGTPADVLVVIEGPAYGAKGAGGHILAGNWWLIVSKLMRLGHLVAVCNPSSLKQWMTGGCKAGKGEMIAAAVTRFPHISVLDDNQADAIGLCSLGYHWLGAPIVQMPKTHQAAVAKVEWPEVARVNR